MLAVKVSITRYLGDDPQPGIVECKLTDAWGREWTFHDKVPIFTDQSLDSQSTYPQEGTIAGNIIRRRQDASGREIVTFDTEEPDRVDTVQGETRFDLTLEQLTEI